MSWIRFNDVLAKRLENILKTLENVWKVCWRRMTKANIFVLIKMSWRRHKDVFSGGITKANILVFKTSSRSFMKIFTKTSSRGIEDVFTEANVCLAISHIIYFEFLLCNELHSVGNMYWWTFLRGLFLLLFPTNFICCSKWTPNSL